MVEVGIFKKTFMNMEVQRMTFRRSGENKGENARAIISGQVKNVGPPVSTSNGHSPRLIPWCNSSLLLGLAAKNWNMAATK